MDPNDLLPSDIAILDVLQEGRATQAMLIDETGYSKQQVYSRLNVLVAAGHVTRVHERSALYGLVSDPRKDEPSEAEGDS